MDVSFADGHEASYQFVPGIGAAGFLLSPLVEDAPAFDALADGAPPPASRVVTGFRLRAPGWPALPALVSPRIAVELRDVSGGDAPPSTAPVTAWAALIDARGLARDAPVVAAEVPSRLTLPADALSRVDLGFGLALAEDAPPGAERLCFAVRPVAAGAGADVAAGTDAAPVLWRRCLDRAVEADRAPQSVSLALPPGTAELALETTCEAGCDEGLGGYWGPPA